MRRLKLNEDMVRRIEEALDERRYQRRGPLQPGFPEDRRTPSGGRRESDTQPPPAVEDPLPGLRRP